MFVQLAIGTEISRNFRLLPRAKCQNATSKFDTLLSFERRDIVSDSFKENSSNFLVTFSSL